MSEVDTLSGDNSTVYTPTTEVVEANYEYSNWLQRAGDREQYEAEFNRWLAEVKADAWEEGLYAGAADSYFGYPDNPYRQVGDL